MFPDAGKMAHFARLIQSREPATDDVFGFMDGLALTSECTFEDIEQNAMYYSYHSDTIMTNILPYIRNNIGNYKMCVDQGFPRTGDASQILVGPISKRQA